MESRGEDDGREARSEPRAGAESPGGGPSAGDVRPEGRARAGTPGQERSDDDVRPEGGAGAEFAPVRLRPAAPGGRGGGRRRGELLRRILRVPLFYKILLANAVLVAGATLLGAAAAVAVRGDTLRLQVLVVPAGAAVVATLVANALILRAALSPLQRLEDAARRIARGDLDARAPASELADRELERLIQTFNAMLDGLALNRRRLREIAARALRAQEEERLRVARELHDDTAQRLAALLIRLRLLERLEDRAAFEAGVREARDELARTLEGVRHFIRGLRPPALEQLGVAAAIEEHARQLAESSGLDIRVRAARVGDVLDPDAELALFRSVQEALSNVVRHAGATRAQVVLRRRDGTVEAVIQDDGRGFEPEEVVGRDGQGFGLLGMRERAAYVGGSVEIRSEPGKGTRVRIRVPAGPARG